MSSVDDLTEYAKLRRRAQRMPQLGDTYEGDVVTFVDVENAIIHTVSPVNFKKGYLFAKKEIKLRL